MKYALAGLFFVMVAAAPAPAIVIDGMLDASGYGAALAVQDTPTGFGNNQSELNAAFANLDGGGNLSLMLTGNLQDGGNGLVVFIDSRAGGAVSGGTVGSVGGARIDDWGTDTDGGGGVNPTPGGGSILDAGFNPDVALEINVFGNYFTNIIDLTLPNDGDPDVDNFLGGNALGSTSANQTYTRNDGDTAKGHNGAIEHAFDNSNTAGVTDTDASGALTAVKGYEALLSAAFLANDGQPIKIMAFITNNDGGFLSNQFLGEAGLGGAGNLGGPGGAGGAPLFDASLFAGNQFFVVPEPASLALVLTGGLVALRRRRA